jgi:hypothetical protein
VKSEVSKIETLNMEKIAELSAIFRNISSVDKEIKITTENASVARRIFNLVKDLYGINAKIVVRRGYNFNKSYLYILQIDHNINKILSDLSIFEDSKYLLIPKKYIVDDEDLTRAYLRGLFMAVGSINDPKKSRYHLEFLVDSDKYAEFISSLLNTYNLNGKCLKRENKYMIYIKEAEKISDFLRIINASNAVLYYEDIRIYRDHKNMTNRLNNCEQANVDKIIMTANEQIREIELIKSIGGLDLLDPKIRDVAIYRVKYPEASLAELSEIISIETGNIITKSGLHHRFNKIKLLAQKIKESEKKQ